ncbi:MAG: hypothetical protein F6K56_04550 [Moorea sp. SIO3G5]|nr:hypothetical protein [Moorena sp. SIO3G5]
MLVVYNLIKPKLIDHNTKNSPLFPTLPYSLLPAPCSLFPIPYSLFPLCLHLK